MEKRVRNLIVSFRIPEEYIMFVTGLSRDITSRRIANVEGSGGMGESLRSESESESDSDSEGEGEEEGEGEGEETSGLVSDLSLGMKSRTISRDDRYRCSTDAEHLCLGVDCVDLLEPAGDRSRQVVINE